jgi:phosphate transport system permease protein
MRDSDRGAVGVFASGLGTLSVLFLLTVLLAIVVGNAFVWFWPASIAEIEMTDGGTVVGQLFGREPTSAERPPQWRVKVGNREINNRDFVWIDAQQIRGLKRPSGLVRIARTRNGDAYGRIVAVTSMDGQKINVHDHQSVRELVRTASRFQQDLRDLRLQHEKARRPLTRTEHRMDRLRRSHKAGTAETQQALALLQADHSRYHRELGPELERLEGKIAHRRELLAVGRLELAAGDASVTVPLSQMVEVVWGNDMSLLERIVYTVLRGVRFLSEDPRSANTEGGIYPILFGTVLMVLLMSIAVMPFGVLAAVYLDEYAKRGRMLRLVRRAIHNLAGVPSIVFGMFGLAFFVYALGGAVDRSFFADDLPAPTFGTGGILWASLTLAVLTIPVVVVATTEGLQAVPRGWRDGSVALGATRWQTLRSVVLPAAVPGMLTGLILAVGRAAGEVAPLMLTGAVKLAHGLPLDGEPPFLHLQRKFMHLGFHIYDISMQSPDVEASKPMAFASTLVLLALVVIINLTAIVIRRHLHSVYRVLEE